MTTKTICYSMSWEKELTLTAEDKLKLVKTFFKVFFETLRLEGILGLI